MGCKFSGGILELNLDIEFLYRFTEVVFKAGDDACWWLGRVIIRDDAMGH